MKKKWKNTEKYSKEVEEILVRRPAFLVRFGILILVFVVAILLAVAAFITYPERLTTSINFPDSPVMKEGRCIGEVVLTADAASLLSSGQEVKMELGKRDDPETSITVEGRIFSKQPIGSGDFYTIYITHLSADTLTGYEGVAQIVTGESSLLSRIINPVFSVFRTDDRTN